MFVTTGASRIARRSNKLQLSSSPGANDTYVPALSESSSTEKDPNDESRQWLLLHGFVSTCNKVTKSFAFVFVFMKTSRTFYMHYTLMTGIMQQAAWCEGPQLSPWTSVFAFVFSEPLHHVTQAHSLSISSLMPAFIYSLQLPATYWETTTLCVMKVVTTRALLRECAQRMAFDVGTCLLFSVLVALGVYAWEHVSMFLLTKHPDETRLSRKSESAKTKTN